MFFCISKQVRVFFFNNYLKHCIHADPHRWGLESGHVQRHLLERGSRVQRPPVVRLLHHAVHRRQLHPPQRVPGHRGGQPGGRGEPEHRAEGEGGGGQAEEEEEAEKPKVSFEITIDFKRVKKNFLLKFLTWDLRFF